MHDADGNRIAEYDYDDVAQTATLLREYVWMNGENVAVIEGGVIYYTRTDHIGRPIFATDVTGTKIWETSYLPFGGIHTSTGANSTLRFPGQWFQLEAGLHQNWMRDYDPTTGRYMQADPLGLVDGASIYGYALQNPGRYTDPRGEAVDPREKMGIPESIEREGNNCPVVVAANDKKKCKGLSKIPRVGRALFLACTLYFGGDGNPDTKTGGSPGAGGRPSTNPPRDDGYTSQPIEPPKKTK